MSLLTLASVTEMGVWELSSKLCVQGKSSFVFLSFVQ